MKKKKNNNNDIKSIKRILCIDPASNFTGVGLLRCEISVDNIATLSIEWTDVVKTINSWNNDKKICFLSNFIALLVYVERPDVVVSEQPWGLGSSKEILSQLVGAIKAHLIDTVAWQTVSQARKLVVSNGSADKKESAESLLKFPFTKNSKNVIIKLINEGRFDETDAIMHGLGYLINIGVIQNEEKNNRTNG